MLLTLGAAGATLLVMLAVLVVPAIDACNGDGRGLAACLRGIVNDKFDLGEEGEPPVLPQPEALPAAKPIVADTPEVDEPPAPDLQLADAPAAEPARSLVPQVAEQPATPEPTPATPKVIAEPPVAAVPDLQPVAPEPVVESEPQVAEALDAAAAPPETIALAKVIEPAPEPIDVPAVVPPPPEVAVDGVPPDLQVAATVAEPLAEPAPDFTLPPPPDLPATPPPDLQVAAAEPLPVAEPAPAFALPVSPDLPAAPPPDLTVAAIDPVVPPVGAAPAAPVLAPTIDAVEIEGDGNFIAGNGPAGATMRLYVDGVPAGMSPVEGGRWLVEGTDLLTEEQQILKVEALDPVTGKVLGEATVIFEGPVEPVADTPAVVDEPVADAVAPAVEPTTRRAESEEQAAAPEPEPASILPIEPVVPAGESASVTILAPSGDATITTLPTGKPSDDALVTLGAATPKSPAVIAHFTLPSPEAAADVTVLRAVPIGDPAAGRFVSGKAIIRRGDTLWDIAHRYYGHGVHYRTIFRANRELIARPGKIYPGQVFDLPLVYDD